MGTINAKDFLDELIFCLGEKDLVKAKALLQFASDSDIDAEIQRKALVEIAKAPDQTALPLLEYLTGIQISDAEVKQNFYDLILDKSFGSTDLVIQYIKGENRNARILFTRAAGDLQLSETAAVLQDMIAVEQEKKVLIETVTALGKIRAPGSMEILASIAGHEDIELKREAIFAIAEYNNAKAIDQLIKFIGDNEETNKFAIEAIAEVQDLYALEQITKLLQSNITIVRDTAIDQLIKLGNKVTPILTNAFNNAESDYLVHLVTTLGYIGDPSAVTPIIDIVNTQPKDANIRQAAYEAMERIPSKKTAIALVQGLQDPVESVRMSAARAIDKNLSKPLVAGLRNVVREESEDSGNAVSALIDSESSNIFNFLAEEESFLKLAEKHIREKADANTKKAFLQQMSGIGQGEFAKRLAGEVTEEKPGQKKDDKIVVVDDSKMMLKLYSNKLTALGYASDVYHMPEDAIPAVLENKPDLVITDLNMPNISGLELTREIRKKYTRNDLPILMITTQSDFVEEKDGDINVNDSILKKSGINKILHKPFTDEEFKETIEGFLK